jgi:hypothetical protein
VRITDPNYSVTNIVITVLPATLSTNIETAVYDADSFCVSNSAHTACPDGGMRLATTLLQIPGAGPLANGTDSYTLVFMARDRYGNRISTGNVAIEYGTSVKNIQTIFGDNISYMPSNEGDAIIGDFANIF